MRLCHSSHILISLQICFIFHWLLEFELVKTMEKVLLRHKVDRTFLWHALDCHFSLWQVFHDFSETKDVAFSQDAEPHDFQALGHTVQVLAFGQFLEHELTSALHRSHLRLTSSWSCNLSFAREGSFGRLQISFYLIGVICLSQLKVSLRDEVKTIDASASFFINYVAP